MKIEHRICRNNLGETDNIQATQYAEKLADALRNEYPDADIIVNLKSDFANACQTFVSGADDDQPVRERVGEIANYVWERI